MGCDMFGLNEPLSMTRERGIDDMHYLARKREKLLSSEDKLAEEIYK